jgi:hypothetical protein
VIFALRLHYGEVIPQIFIFATKLGIADIIMSTIARGSFGGVNWNMLMKLP